jgi:hypothetical protein
MICRLQRDGGPAHDSVNLKSKLENHKSEKEA